jgi:CBS domain-containing protein
MPLVRDVMTATVTTVSQDATVEEAIETMLARRVTSVPVLDLAGRLAGIISESQLMVLVYNQYARHAPVASFMTRDVVSVDEGATLNEAATRLIVNRVRSLPVVYSGRVTGIVSRTDLLRYAVAAPTPLETGLLLAAAD